MHNGQALAHIMLECVMYKIGPFFKAVRKYSPIRAKYSVRKTGKLHADIDK